MLSKPKKRLLLLFPFAGILAFSAALSSMASSIKQDNASPKLTSVRQNTKMPWNAVAVDSSGRFIVSSPLWTGNKGPAVAVVNESGALLPYPNQSWNEWHPGGNAAAAFVSINAIHYDAKGYLWIVDTGAPEFGGAVVENGPKVVRIDPRTDTVIRVYPLPPQSVRDHSYVDDIRVNGNHAYLTDAGEGAILVLNLDDGSVKRRFEGMPFVRARATDVITVNGKILSGGDGTPLKVNADPLELSPDGKRLYFGPLAGPLSQIETRYLDDDSLNDGAMAKHVTFWFDIPPVGGTAMDKDGNLYYTPLSDNSLMRRSPDDVITTVAKDSRLRWVDAPFLDGSGSIYLPVPQIDGAPAFNHGRSTVTFPFEIYKIGLHSAKQ